MNLRIKDFAVLVMGLMTTMVLVVVIGTLIYSTNYASGLDILLHIVVLIMISPIGRKSIV